MTTLDKSKDWHQIFDNFDEGILLFSNDLTILYANPIFSNFFEFTSRDIIGEKFSEIIIKQGIENKNRWVDFVGQIASISNPMEILVRYQSDKGIGNSHVSFYPLETEFPESKLILSIWRTIGSQIFDEDFDTGLEAPVRIIPGSKVSTSQDLVTLLDLGKLMFLPVMSTGELLAIKHISEHIHHSLTKKELTDFIIEEVYSLLSVDFIILFLQENGELVSSSWIPKDDRKSEERIICDKECICSVAAMNNETIIVDDLSSQQICSNENYLLSAYKSAIILPIGNQEFFSGILCLASKQEYSFTKNYHFLRSVSNQVSLALSNLILYEHVRDKIAQNMKTTGKLTMHKEQLEKIIEDRTIALAKQYKDLQREVSERKKAEQAEKEQRAMAEALEKTASILTSTLDIDEVLDSILLTLEDVIPHDSANIMLIDDTNNIAEVARYKGNPRDKYKKLQPTSHFSISETPTLSKMYHTRQPFLIDDVKQDSNWIDQIGSDWIRSYIAAPIISGESVLGFLNLVSEKPNFYSQIIADRLQAFANHASIAIRNARLYDKAGEAAVLEERQRIARDMHDSVSQTLFAANVIADSLPAQWERNPEKGQEGLEAVRRLIQGALAELRTILIELRPDTITRSDLGELIQQLATGMISYKNLAISCDISGKQTLPPDVQLTFYRIAQEVFNNISKHSKAKNVDVRFSNSGRQVSLFIKDDGVGFDPKNPKTGRMGISIMKERARDIGARLHISSSPDQGTVCEIIWNSQEGIDERQT